MNKIFPFLLILLASPALFAEILSDVDDQAALSLTIYNTDLALIRDRRRVELPAGEQELAIRGVSGQLQPETALLESRSGSGGIRVLEQNFNYDLLTPKKLLEKYLGRQIGILRTNPATGVETRETATVLSTQDCLVVRIGDRIETDPGGRFLFENIPATLRDQPTLVTRLEVARSGTHLLELSYLSGGLSWKSDYTLYMGGDKKLDLNAWVTISNESGATYRDANLTVVAGEVNKAVSPAAGRTYIRKMMAVEDEGMIRNEAFSGYHLYKIPFRETIRDKEKKQISFIRKKGVGYSKYAFNEEPFYFSNFGERKLRFSQVVEFENSEKNGLGIPLPRGTVRVYKKDSSGISRFVGASGIRDIPRDETVKLTIGKYFDIVGKERVTAFKETKRAKQISYEITVSNHGEEEVLVKLKKNVPANQGKLTITDSCIKACTKKRLNAFSTLYTVRLEPHREYTWSISYDMKVY